MEAETTTLDLVPVGRAVTVVELCTEDPVGRRIADMGLWVGRRVTVVRRAPLGDPVQVRVGGYELAMRCAELRRVRVREGGES